MKTLITAMLSALTLAGCADLPVYERTTVIREPLRVVREAPRVIHEPPHARHERVHVVHGNALPVRKHDRDHDTR